MNNILSDVPTPLVDWNVKLDDAVVPPYTKGVVIDVVNVGAVDNTKVVPDPVVVLPKAVTVPLVGRVKDVVPDTVSVVPKLPVMVNVLAALFATPVPPLAADKVPAKVIAPVVPELGVKPVVPALNEVTPIVDNAAHAGTPLELVVNTEELAVANAAHVLAEDAYKSELIATVDVGNVDVVQAGVVLEPDASNCPAVAVPDNIPKALAVE